MSTQDSSRTFTYSRSSRRRKIRIMGVNVEVPQPSEQSQRQPACQNVQGLTRNVSGSAVPTAPVHVEAQDDDVVILSPREYEEATNRRFRGPNLVVDLSADLMSSSNASNRNLRRRITPTESPASCNCSVKLYVMRRRDPPARSETFAICDCFLDRMTQPTVAQSPPPPPPAPPEPTFMCPICMGPMVEAVTTKCGHIFCRGCIRQAIIVFHNKCPTCRSKVLVKDLRRIYLPNDNN